MRYRRLSYRYAVVMAAGRPRPLGEGWQRPAAGVGVAQPAWRPAADVIETATDVIVTVELAGVDHEELDVLLFEDALIVEGERRLPPAQEAAVYHAAEIRQGRLRLELPLLCPIDPDQVEAHYERGLLELRLRKRPSGGSGCVSIPISRVVDSTVVDPTTAATRRGAQPESDEHGV